MILIYEWRFLYLPPLTGALSILKARRVCLKISIGDDATTRKMIDTGLTCLVGSHALFIERGRSAFLVVYIGVRTPRFSDVIASSPQLAESCPVNAIVEAVALFLLTYVGSFHHALRLSSTLDSTLPYSAKRWDTTVVTPSRIVTPYRASAISMVRFWCVITISCEVS